MTDSPFSDAWLRWRTEIDLDEYDQRFDREAAAGHDVHGEAAFVMGLEPSTVLDAGCGMGRVAIELDRRGVDVVGIDLDPDLLARARRRAPHLSWIETDLATARLDRRFDLVVMAGNVLPFAKPDLRPAIVATCASHLETQGALVAGASLTEGWPTVAQYERWCHDAGLQLVERFAGWDREPFTAASGYAVSVHRRSP